MQTYRDPHDASRVIEVKAITREFGTIPGLVTLPKPKSRTVFSTKVLWGNIYSNGRRWSAETPSGETATFVTFNGAAFWLEMDKYIHSTPTNRGENLDGIQKEFNGFQSEEVGYPRVGMAASENDIPNPPKEESTFHL